VMFLMSFLQCLGKYADIVPFTKPAKPNHFFNKWFAYCSFLDFQN